MLYNSNSFFHYIGNIYCKMQRKDYVFSDIFDKKNIKIKLAFIKYLLIKG